MMLRTTQNNDELHPQSLNFPLPQDCIDCSPLKVTSDIFVVDAIVLMNQQQTSCIFVIEDSQLVGTFTERDIVRLTAAKVNFFGLRIKEVMTKKVITLKQSDALDLFAIVSLLHQHQIRHLPILDDNNQLLGVITSETIRQALQPANFLKLRYVGDLMTTQVIHAPPTTSVLHIAQLMDEHKVSCVAIAETSNSSSIPIGIITERDIVQFQVLKLDFAHTPAENVMSAPLFCLNPTDSLWFAHQEMQRRYVRRLVVTGEQGELQGIITQTSFLEVLERLEMSAVIVALQQRVENQTNELKQANEQLKQEIVQRQQVEAQLRKATDELEIIVAERTFELSQTNALLQQKIRDRELAFTQLQQTEANLQQELTERKRAELALQQRTEQQQLVAAIAQRIRASLNLDEVLNTTVAEVRQFLNGDRVFIYRFQPNYSGTVVVEAVGEGWISALHIQIEDTYFQETAGEEYRQGRIQAVADIQTAGLAQCHFDLLAQFQIRANLAVPILQGEKLWGLLVVNQCSAPRLWQQWEIDLMNQLSTQVGIAIQQSELYQQVQAELMDRKQAEQKIREQAALLNITSDAIIVRNLSHEILFWNRGAEFLYGWSATEALGQNANQLLYKKSLLEVEAALKTVMTQGEWHGELHQVTKDGVNIIVEGRWTIMRDEIGNPKSILVVNTNITEQKQLEAQFLRAQRLESLGTLASGIAHDLNNILTPILTSSQLLVLKLNNLDAKNQQLLKIIESNSKRGADLIKQILTFVRGSEGKRQPLQIENLLAEIQHITESTFPKSINININLSTTNLWTVLVDPTQIHQVLMNLCVNARDAMPNGGALHLQAENIFIDATYAKMHLDAQVGQYVAITVSDTGVGIPRHLLDRIFEPFFTTKEQGKGTGLGLSTVIGIIKNHGGFVNVSSEIGKGTQFQVYLPAGSQHTSQPAETAELHNGRGETVLVVDDESAIVEIVKASLEDHNYKTLTASNGIEAISLYSQRHDEISLVLLDMMMPSMDGLTTIRVLQQINPQVKIIVMSGVAARGQLAEFSNINIFLHKPYTINELLQAIEQAQQE